METLGQELATYLTLAWLLPLAGFTIEVFGGYLWSRLSKRAALLAVGCIATSFLLSAFATIRWGNETDWGVYAIHEAAHHSVSDDGKPSAEHHDADDHHAPVKAVFSGPFYRLAQFGELDISLDYYIDSLTLLMFCMVTFIATCIHIFAMGYMSDELTEEYVDHHAHDSHGHHVHRPGRFYRFFSYLSLFCFAMLGLVLAGNIFQVFMFWELVGICSFLLIGFYVERKSANVAANKAFIVNRVGDFGFIIGLMILWTYCGTFRFSEYQVGDEVRPGLFEMVRGDNGEMTLNDAGDTVGLKTVKSHGHWSVPEDGQKTKTVPYLLLVVAGLGVFGGCVGKSAQFPLQTWLPDAMEGPTPVSALVHSATMVAAGVYLAARFFPVFTSEVLLAIAYVGCITLFVAATIAIVATDIKRVLAYSTISQLGYMMLAIGLGGWGAGLFHLVTHAFFKSLMFLCSGAVIYGCHHVQEMPQMGGLLKKMPITGLAMLVGVIAIAGLAVPAADLVFGFPLAFSGYHSKDAIVATALAYTQKNPLHFLLFLTPLITAGITSFYMFRLWFYTFTGKPRDQHVYEHCHEVPRVMWIPLVVLCVPAMLCGVLGDFEFKPGTAKENEKSFTEKLFAENDTEHHVAAGERGTLYKMISFAEPIGLAEGREASGTANVALPAHGDIHAVHGTAGAAALLSAFLGMITAFLLYCRPIVDPGLIKNQFSGLYQFLVNKWQFDELYDALFVRPAHSVARWAAGFDKLVLDGILHGASRVTVVFSMFDRRFDEAIVDGLVNLVGNATRIFGESLKVFQTGRIRQYVMFIAVSVVALFAILFAVLPKA